MSFQDRIIQTGGWFFKYRNIAFPAVLLALFILLPPRPFMGSPVLDAWLDMLGLFVVHNNALAYLLGLIFFGAAYWGIIAAEEKFLAEKFGEDYRAYCARVNRFWLNFSGYKDAVEGMRFNWRRVVIKDYSTLYTWIAGMMVLIAWEHAHWSGRSFIDALQSVLIPLAIATAITLLVRVLKKRGVLSEQV